MWTSFLAAPKENGGLGVHLPGVYHKQLRDAFETLDLSTGRREPVALRDDLKANDGSYANRVLGSLMMSGRCIRLSTGVLGTVNPTTRLLSTTCTLCGGTMSPDHMNNCKYLNKYRVARHDIVVSKVYDHLATGSAVIHEQKTWVAGWQEPEA